MGFIHQNPLLSAHLRERNYLREYLSTVHREELELDPWGRPNYHLYQDLTQTSVLLGQHDLWCKTPLQGLSNWRPILIPWSLNTFEEVFNTPLFQTLLWSVSSARWLIRSAIIYSCVDFVYKLLHLLVLGSQFWSSLLKINNTYLLRETLGKASCDGFCYTSWH